MPDLGEWSQLCSLVETFAAAARAPWRSAVHPDASACILMHPSQKWREQSQTRTDVVETVGPPSRCDAIRWLPTAMKHRRCPHAQGTTRGVQRWGDGHH